MKLTSIIRIYSHPMKFVIWLKTTTIAQITILWVQYLCQAPQTLPSTATTFSSFRDMVIFLILKYLSLDLFDMDTYEYHETKDSIPKGFVFGLFSLKNASTDEIKSALLQSKEQNIIGNLDGSDCL